MVDSRRSDWSGRSPRASSASAVVVEPVSNYSVNLSPSQFGGPILSAPDLGGSNGRSEEPRRILVRAGNSTPPSFPPYSDDRDGAAAADRWFSGYHDHDRSASDGPPRIGRTVDSDWRNRAARRTATACDGRQCGGNRDRFRRYGSPGC